MHRIANLSSGLMAAYLCFGMACGDDTTPVTPDSKPAVDAPKPFVEAPIGFDGQDGGEVRMENFVFPDGVTRILNTAYFINAQTGKMPFPIINTGTAKLMCNHQTDHIYPFGDGSDSIGVTASWAPGGRHYMDIGEKITFTPTGGKPAFDLPLYENFVTPFMGGSFHNLTYNVAPSADPLQTTDPVSMGGQGDNVGGQKMSLTIPGGPDLSARVLDFEGEFSGIEIPPRPVVAGFAVDGCPKGTSDANCPTRVKSAMDISRSTDFIKTWTIPASAPPDLLTFIAIFKVPPGEVFMLCVADHPGSINLPKEELATMPDQGILFIAHLLHRTRTFDNNRRVDMVGTACTSTFFTMVP